MSEEKKYRNYTTEDIEKYHKGLLLAKEMHELEKAALDDPFLADALEGYGTVSVNVAADLSDLERKLKERATGAKVVSMAAPRNSFKWWKIAAAVIIVGGVGFFTFRLSTSNSDNKVARLEEKKKSNGQAATPIIDSSKGVTPDANGTAKISTQTKKTSTAVTSEKKTSGTSFEATADTNKDFAAAPAKPEASAPLSFKQEKKDSVDSQKNEIGYRDVYAKSAAKKSEPDNRQAEGAAVMQQKEIGVRDQQRINYFRGRVVDANYNPLPFANITNTRDNVGTYADASGNFTLISPDSSLDVQIRSVGFENNLAKLRNNVATNQVIMQEDKTSPDKIISYKKTDTTRSRTANMKFEEPEPADGWSNYDVYLANNVNVPDDLKRKQTNNGQVQISFQVNQDGNPVNIKVEKSLCQKCDEEAIRLIKEGPKWKMKNRKTKRVTITVPFDTIVKYPG